MKVVAIAAIFVVVSAGACFGAFAQELSIAEANPNQELSTAEASPKTAKFGADAPAPVEFGYWENVCKAGVKVYLKRSDNGFDFETMTYISSPPNSSGGLCEMSGDYCVCQK